MSENLEIGLSIVGFDDAQVGSLIGLSWKIESGLPPRPGLELQVLRTPKWELGQVAPSGEEESQLTVDASLLDAGRRWIDDERLELLVIAMPISVRLEGAGFLTVAPSERMPFGLDIDPDRLRIVVPLYLPEAKLAGCLKVRPIRAGRFALSARRVSATSDGKLQHVETLYDDERQLEDREPVIIVQDTLDFREPRAIWNSPTGEFYMRIFDDYFEIFDSVSGGLILDLFGERPWFSPTSRFLSYKLDNVLFVVDVAARKTIFSMSERYDEGVESLSFVNGDTYLVAGGASYGTVGVWSTLCDEPVERHWSDLFEWPLDWDHRVGQAHECHACRMHPFDVYWNLEEGCIVVAYAGEESDVLGRDRFPLGIAGFFIKSLVDRDLVVLHPPRFDTPFLRRTAPPPSLGVTYFNKWNAAFDLPEEQRVVEATFREHLTKMQASTALPARHLPSLTGRPVSRDFGVSLDAAVLDLEEAVSSFMRKRGVNFETSLAPTASQSRRFSRLPIADGDTRQDDPFDQLVARLGLLNQGASEVLSVGPRFYDGIYDSADFGYGLEFSYWQWSGPDQSCLITTESYDSQGSSGVYSGRICLFRKSRPGDGAQIDRQCSLADWHQDYSRDDGAGAHVFGEIERGVYGVGGAPRPMQAFRVGRDRFALVAPRDRVVALIGDASIETIATFRGVTGAASVRSLRLSSDGALMLQLNGGGRFYIYSVAEGTRALSGVCVDGEIVLYSDDGFYDGTPDGARYVHRYFVGAREHHAFSQFASRFNRPDLIQSILRGGNASGRSAEIVAPPTVEFDLVPGSLPGAFCVRLKVRSDADLKVVRLFVDGAPRDEIVLSGKTAAFERSVEIANGVHWVTAVAYNTLGFSSIPKTATAVCDAADRHKGRLFYVGVAVDRYPRLRGMDLRFAKRDMRLLADTIAKHGERQYRSILPRELCDEQVSCSAVLAALAEAAASATVDDTLLVAFAGHGERAGDRFYFLTSQTALEDVPGTALLWDQVAEVLLQCKARVIVLLDACHAGVASQEAVVPNDEYAAALVRSVKVGMVVLAAAKGTQTSQERDDLMGGHGVFSYAVAQALGSDREAADVNGNGVVELSELYRYVKRTVAQLTGGAQTAWLSRDEIIGEAPVM